MKIRRIRAFRVDLPLHEGSYKWSGGKEVRVFDSTVVEVETDSGVVGYGEVCPLGPFYLPAYSPDLNPIEQLFAKLKALLRKIAAYTLKNRAFTVERLCKTVAWCLDQISRAECAAYLANSGYGQPKRTAL